MSDLSKIRYEFYSLKKAVEDELRKLLHLDLKEDADPTTNSKNLNTLLTCLETDVNEKPVLFKKSTGTETVPKELKIKVSCAKMSSTFPAKTSPNATIYDKSVPKEEQINVSCALCRSNGETKSFVRSHSLKDSDGLISCPVLRRYVCPICGVTGDYAHTVRYCPKNTGHRVPPEVLKHLRNATGHNFVYKKKYC